MASRWLVELILCAAVCGQAPPLDLVKRVAARESESEAVRAHYTYRQTVTIEELDSRGAATGLYREVRDIIFSPAAERTEQLIGKPIRTLVRLRLTEEDFRDIREVQPLLLTADRLPLYRARFRGGETIDDVACWVIDVQPRQVLDRQRLFEGYLWIDQRDYSIIRSEGRAVPQIHSTTHENLFPRFTTVRQRMDNGFWFPLYTHADDVLEFRTGPQRIRMRIYYSDYKRFGADSTVKFEPIR